MAFFLNNKPDEVEIARRTMEACEEMMVEMGADLHDEVLQRLTVLKFSLDRLQQTVSGDREVDLKFVELKSEFKETMAAIRATSRGLFNVQIKNDPFHHSLSMLCQSLEKPGHGKIYFESIGQEEIISVTAKTFLYRILQELIYTSFKYSSAWNIWVRLVWDEEHLIMDVEDDGSGFSTIDELNRLLTMKHNTMRLRLIALQADLEYHQGRDGLLARVAYPINHKPDH